MNMPTQAWLRGRLNHSFRLRIGAHAVLAELVAVSQGVPMNRNYQCYAAEFALPAGLQLASALFAVSADDDLGNEWPLLLNPVQPAADGRARMEAVFHLAAEQGQQQALSRTAEEHGLAVGPHI